MREFNQPRFHPDRLLCNTGIETALAIAGAVGAVGSAGMGIIGASQQSAAQRAAGDAAYAAALQRNEQAQLVAKQREDQANAEQAAAQRKAIEEKRKAGILAGRAQAVMAASGGGVDTRIVAGLLGEGDYASDAALYEGDSRAQKLRYQASLDRYEGKTGLQRGQYSRDVANWQADNTMAMGIGKGIFQGLSLAAKYGGELPGTGGMDVRPGIEKTGVDAEGFRVTDWSKYDLNGRLIDG